MDFHIHGGSPSPSASSSSSSSHHLPNHHHHHTPSPNGHSSTATASAADPMRTWWESVNKARSRVLDLSSLLPSETDKTILSSLADTDHPSRSLLLSSAAYSSFTAALSADGSGSSDDPLCQWLYDTYLSSDPDLRLVVLSYIPLLVATYLHRVHYPNSPTPPSLSGFEAVLLALYSSETKARNGKPLTISIPDLSQPSLYHSPRPSIAKSPPNSPKAPVVGIISPPLEPQIAVKSTKRACIVGVALDCYYKQISQMPSWSKLDFCRFVAVWAGQDCPCTSEFDVESHENGFGEVSIVDGDDIGCEIESVVEGVRELDIVDGNSGKDLRIPLPWELLQPVLRILGHCLLGPLIADEVKCEASVAAKRLYARASHDLVPQAILATKSLIQLDNRAREAVKTAAMAAANGSSSNVNTPSKAKKPEILLVSK